MLLFIQWLLSCLAHTFLMTDLPICWINTSSYIWTPAQRPTPLVVRQVCYLGGKLFIAFIKLKEVVHGEELSPIWGETPVSHYEVKVAHPAKAEDEWQACEASRSVGLVDFCLCEEEQMQLQKKSNCRKSFATGENRRCNVKAHPERSSLVVFPPASWWHLCPWGPPSRRTRWPL